jgi:subtilisin-like proprotein convertase family protein
MRPQTLRALLPLSLAASLAAPARADVHVSAAGALALPDQGTATATLAIPEARVVRDVNVLLRLEHPAPAHLSATLRHPDGSSVALFANPAATGQPLLLCFDDEAQQPFAGAVPGSGSYAPAASLAAFDGKSTAGEWRLELGDNTAGSLGELRGFALAFDVRTYLSEDVPQPIVDLSATLSELVVAEDFTVLDVEVGLDLSHALLSDVDGRLQSPQAFTPVLFQNLGGFGGPGGMVLTVFDDEADQPIQGGSQPFTGRFQPMTRGALAAFDGTGSQGSWFLNLFDDELEDQGTLLGWWLHLTTDELPPVAQVCQFEQVLDFPFSFGAGGAVAVADGRLFVGLPQASPLGLGSGEVQVYEREPLFGSWQLAQPLYAVGGKGLARFGSAISADGERLAVGAPNADGGSGNVTIFERNPAGSWTAQAELNFPGALAFGRTVDLVGDRVAIGSHRVAFVFTRVGASWLPTFSASAGSINEFATAVALAGDQVLVGDPAGGPSPTAGVFVFPLAGGAPTKLTPSLAQFGDRFGATLSVSGDRFATGADGYDGAANSTGLSYVFRRTAGVWSEEAALEPAGLVAFDRFGADVALVDEVLWVSAEGNGQQNLRRFELGAGGWALAELLDGPGNTVVFGETLDTDGEWLLVGAGLGSEAFARGVNQAALSSCTTELSVSAGGTQVLALAAGVPQAGSLYLTLGSAAGTAPALDLGGPQLPLVFDAYLSFTLTAPGSAPLFQGFGLLDDLGRATVNFTLPPGSAAALAGLILNHACAAIDLGGPSIAFTSNAVSLRLSP